MNKGTPILQVKDFRASFHTRRGIARVINGISYELYKGETLAIVGESGSGKTVSQLSYLGLLPSPPLKIDSGEILFHGTDLLKTDDVAIRKIRGDRITMIFQEPMTSLNPYMKIGKQLIEPLVYHKGMCKREAWKEAISALEKVRLPNADRAMNSYPHEFSGGMRQRVMIAMALTTKPEVLIADEPTTAIDVTVQAQILELLKSIQVETRMSVILITHDLGVVAEVADRVLVMYSGSIFEQGDVKTIFHHSENPYTHALLRSTPRLDIEQGTLPAIEGSPPDLLHIPKGCPFSDRCEFSYEECLKSFPPQRFFKGEHYSLCHLEKLPK